MSGWEQSLWDGTPEGRTEEKGVQKKMVAKRRSWKEKVERAREEILEGRKKQGEERLRKLSGLEDGQDTGNERREQTQQRADPAIYFTVNKLWNGDSYLINSQNFGESHLTSYQCKQPNCKRTTDSLFQRTLANV